MRSTVLTLAAAAAATCFGLTAAPAADAAVAFDPWEDFTPIAGSSYDLLTADWSVPFVVPAGFQQKLVTDENDLDIYPAPTDDLSDMNTVNQTGLRRGRYLYTTKEVERVARFAFELARQRKAEGKPGHVHSVDKANVMEAGAMWRRIVQRVHDAEFPDVTLHHMLADNCAMQLIRWPRQFDVIVTDNLFGDLLSDCGAMITGSLGMLPSASLSARDAHGRRRALYEPIHGSAPDIAGKSLANPLAAILSFAMCLRETLGQAEDAATLERAVDKVLASGARTADLAAKGAPSLSTTGMGDAVVSALASA